MAKPLSAGEQDMQQHVAAMDVEDTTPDTDLQIAARQERNLTEITKSLATAKDPKVKATLEAELERGRGTDFPVVAAIPARPAWESAPVVEATKKPAWESSPIVPNVALQQHFQPVAARSAKSFEDYLAAGFQQSVLGLAGRGKTPDVAVDAETPWYGRALSGFAGLAGDSPAMLAGFLGGAPVGAAVGSAVPVVGTAAGGVVGGFAGAGALPAALRATMMTMYERGEVTSSADFVNRALHVAWETAKGGLTGAATGGAGVVAKGLLPVAAPLAARIAVPTAAEVTAMTTVGRGLEGHLPEPQDFLDAAIVLGGMRAAGATAGKLRTIYARTGKTPDDVVAEAQANPTIKNDILETKGPAPAAEPTPPLGEALVPSPAATEKLSARSKHSIDMVGRINAPDAESPTTVPLPTKGLGNLEMEVRGDKAYEAGIAQGMLSFAIKDAAGQNVGGGGIFLKHSGELGQWESHYFINEPFRRQGVMTAVMDWFEKQTGEKIVPSSALSDDARAFWKSRGIDTSVPAAYRDLASQETARAIVPGDKAAAVAASPFAEIPQAKGEPAKPTHVNYNYLNSAEDAKAALSRLSSVYEEEIQTQRRGTVDWEQTSTEAAKILSDTLGGMDARLLMPRNPGTPAGAAEILARKQLTIGAAEAMMGARDDLLAKGENASPADQAVFLAAIERAAMISSEFLGARAEAGRALNILKSTAMDAERARLIQDVITMYGKDKPLEMAKMLKELDNPAAALKFARDATKATTWEKLVEAWKASILSGPVTHVANILGNTTFMALRAPIDGVAALIGMMRSGPDKVTLAEPLARMGGALAGTLDGLKLAAAVMRTGEQPGKAEQFRKAIEGTKGEVIRLPFRFLSAEDAIFSTMNHRGELYSQAANQSAREGLNPATREFRERMAVLVDNPTPDMLGAAKESAERFTFNTPLGEKGQAVQQFVRAWHLEWMVPFIRTPGNIFKELTRMTPLAPIIGEWRADFAKGGAARDKAFAELAVGSGIMTAVFMHALEGNISGAGDPDPGKRRTQMAAGWQPYSWKIGDTWYNYQRLQPLGTLVGLAADVANVWDHLTEEEADKVPKMLSVAFANAVTNQTFLQGITNIVNALSDPKRFGPKLVQQYAGSVVPAVVAQPTQMLDPIVREVDSVLDAIKARVPGMRGELLPKRDIFGEPQQTKERLGGLSPITETKESEDKVRTEAARLGVSAADTPKKVHLGRGSGKLGDVKLAPEQRDRFAEVGGKLAHEILAQVVNTPGWDDLPDLIKKRAYQKVFTQAHRAAAAEALPADMREGLLNQITEKVQAELAPNE